MALNTFEQHFDRQSFDSGISSGNLYDKTSN